MNCEEWLKELKSEEKAHSEFRDAAKQVVERFEDEEDRDDTKYNILWANTEVLHSAVYNKRPTPDIRRRFLDKDKAGKDAAEIAERCVTYALDSYDFDGTADVAIDDYLVAGLGQVRLRYKPYFEQGEAPRVPLEVREAGFDENMNMTYGAYNGDEQVDDYMQDDYGHYMMGDPEEKLVYAEVTCEPVNWSKFRWEPCITWETCDWTAIEHYPTNKELVEMYGKKLAARIPMGYTDQGDKAETDDDHQRARIYEIFDRKERKNIEICEGLNEILKETDDPLTLESYYPFPKPLMATLKNGKFCPIPDFMFYQDQAMELDNITMRIDRLTDELKHRGVYDGSFTALANLEAAGDGEFLPIDDFAQRFNGTQGDLNKVIAAMPLDEIRAALVYLYEAREQIKQTIYEITGIADIMRGTSKASETLGAQQLKTQFGSMRISKRQRKVAQFMRDIVKLKVEIIVENFHPRVIQMMTGMELTEEAYQILTNDMMRSYRIDIETDSTITEDAATEKGQRIELVTAVTGFIEKTGPMVQAGMLPANLAKELLGFAIRGFKIGGAIEDALDEMGGDEGDPRMQEMQGKMQQFQQQVQQMATEFVEGKEQEFKKQMGAMEKKLFEAEKTVAITKKTSEVSIATKQIEGDIQVKTQQDKNEIGAQLEIFKAQLQAIQKIPEERETNMQDLAEFIATAFKLQQDNNQQVFDGLQGQITEGKKASADILEFVKKPAKIIRDNKGRVTGATRE